MQERSLVILGAGGHAKVSISTLRSDGLRPTLVLDDNSDKEGGSLLGVPVESPIEKLSQIETERGFIAIGENRVRRRLARSYNLNWVIARHESAVVHPSAEIGSGALICAGATVQPDVTIGPHAIINTSASIDHDVVVEAFSHVGPGASLCGGVHVEKEVLVGAGSTINPGVRVGHKSQIGSGAAIIHDVPAESTIVGVPGKRIKQRTEEGGD